MGPLEIIAFVVVIVALVKLLFLAFSAKIWTSFIKGIYKNPMLLVFVELILSGIVFYYLLQELTIVQIMACVTFGALLTGMTFAVYGKEVTPLFAKLFKKKSVLKKAWLPIIIWLFLCVWVLKALFF